MLCDLSDIQSISIEIVKGIERWGCIILRIVPQQIFNILPCIGRDHFTTEKGIPAPLLHLMKNVIGQIFLIPYAKAIEQGR